MFGLGSGELIVVLILAIIFVGPEKIPQIATQCGKMMAKIRDLLEEIKSNY